MNGLGAWFAALEARGESSDFLVGRSVEPGAIEWHLLSHVDFDGVGGLGLLLSRFAETRIALPTLPSDDPGGFICALAPWLELLTLRSGWPPTDRRYSGAPEVLWWSAGELEALREAAHARHATIGSLLLWATHRTLLTEARKAGIPAPRQGAWMLAVNMRRNPQPTRFRGNYASFIVGMPGGRSPEVLHLDLSDRLARGEHWAQAANLSRIAAVGPFFLSHSMSCISASSFGFLGLFSNLGVWEVRELAFDSWCVVAPPTDQTPLAVAVLTLNGRLSMSARSYRLPRAFLRRVLVGCRARIVGS